MTTQHAGLFIALLGLLFIITAVIILICDRSRRKKYSAQTMGTVTRHKWIHAEHVMYPVALLSYSVDGQTYQCRQRYHTVFSKQVSHAKQGWVLDEKYRLHRYRAKTYDIEVNPITDWFPVGSQMPVHYVPGRPKKAYCGSLISMNLMVIIMGAVGLFVMGFGGMLMMVM